MPQALIEAYPGIPPPFFTSLLTQVLYVGEPMSSKMAALEEPSELWITQGSSDPDEEGNGLMKLAPFVLASHLRVWRTGSGARRSASLVNPSRPSVRIRQPLHNSHSVDFL